MTTVCASTSYAPCGLTGTNGPVGVSSSDYFVGATGATGLAGPVGVSSSYFGATGATGSCGTSCNGPYEHTRDNHLQAISMMYMNGLPFSKLDCLGYITINGTHFVNVFRRYNSPYEIVVEDYVGDFHMFRDISVKDTIQRVLCLSDEQMKYFHIKETLSFKKCCAVHLSVNTCWSEIHHFHQGVMMDIAGLPIYFPIASAQKAFTQKAPSAPMKESLCPALCSSCVEEISENLFEKFNSEYRKRKSSEDDQEHHKYAKTIKNEVINDVDNEEFNDIEDDENCEEQEEEVESEEEKQEEEQDEETESEEDTFLCLRGRTIKRN
jgi:hypothetical protein